jgi:hypothetical protein
MLSALIGSISAHTIFQEVAINGVSQGHLAGVRVPTYDGFVYRIGDIVRFLLCARSLTFT